MCQDLGIPCATTDKTPLIVIKMCLVGGEKMNINYLLLQIVINIILVKLNYDKTGDTGNYEQLRVKVQIMRRTVELRLIRSDGKTI